MENLKLKDIYLVMTDKGIRFGIFDCEKIEFFLIGSGEVWRNYSCIKTRLKVLSDKTQVYTFGYEIENSQDHYMFAHILVCKKKSLVKEIALTHNFKPQQYEILKEFVETNKSKTANITFNMILDLERSLESANTIKKEENIF